MINEKKKGREQFFRHASAEQQPEPTGARGVEEEMER